MLRLFAISSLFVAASCCNGGGLNSGPVQCGPALADTYSEQRLESSAVTTCIGKQEGLQTIIDRLRNPFSGIFGSLGGSSTRHFFGGNNIFSNMCKAVAELLESNGYTSEATTLRECVARARSMVKADDTYDMDKLKNNIKAKVSGLTIEANTQLGLDNCPDLVEFDVAEYMACITTYCRTGAAP